MATTIASITLSSADIADNGISISSTATLTNAGNDTGMTKTTGLTRITTAATDNIVLINSADATAGTMGAVATITKGKVYIKNLNARGDGSKFVNILIAAVEVGRLYGNDWAFFPFEGGSGNDVELTPSSTTDTDLEFIVFYE